METLFLDAPFTGRVHLCQATLRYLKKKKYQTVALYASVQFVGQLDEVREQLQKAGVKVITSRADRTHVSGQLLGCDNYHDSLRLKKESFDTYLYVGDGKFHPLAIVYGQKDLTTEELKEIICNDPLRDTMTLLGFEDIKHILKRYQAALMKFITAKTVGVIVTIKPGQEQLKPAFLLEQKFPGKQYYYFIDNVVSFDQLENFNFIDVWVNTTCPRVGFDDQEKFVKGVINLNDALRVNDILGKESALNKL